LVFSRLGRWALHGGVAFNHFVEIVVPRILLPQPFADIAASITILFQLLLMLSGKRSFFNLLTIVIALPMLDRRWLAKWACRSCCGIEDGKKVRGIKKSAPQLATGRSAVTKESYLQTLLC
jgi:hypothetical protein